MPDDRTNNPLTVEEKKPRRSHVKAVGSFPSQMLEIIERCYTFGETLTIPCGTVKEANAWRFRFYDLRKALHRDRVNTKRSQALYEMAVNITFMIGTNAEGKPVLQLTHRNLTDEAQQLQAVLDAARAYDTTLSEAEAMHKHAESQQSPAQPESQEDEQTRLLQKILR